MTDKQTLELAAKAYGIKDGVYKTERLLDNGGWEDVTAIFFDDGDSWWNSLKDDGDAFRLGVQLDLLSDPRVISDMNVMMLKGMQKLEAYRYAITHIAALIEDKL